MTSRSIGEILGGLPAPKRTRSNQPVRRNSYDVNDPRASALWKPLGRTNREGRRLTAAHMKAAERFERTYKPFGKRNGPLGGLGLEVLREMHRIVDYKSGRLDPSLDTLCKRTNRSKQAVHDALERLAEQGFLDWVRRSERTGLEGRGPQVRQISNAYALRLPPIAVGWVETFLSDGPLPACEVARREGHATEAEDMLASASIDQQVDYLVSDPTLAGTLKLIGSLIEDASASPLNRQNPISISLVRAPSTERQTSPAYRSEAREDAENACLSRHQLQGSARPLRGREAWQAGEVEQVERTAAIETRLSHLGESK